MSSSCKEKWEKIVYSVVLVGSESQVSTAFPTELSDKTILGNTTLLVIGVKLQDLR